MGFTGAAHFSVSDTGALVYIPAGAGMSIGRELGQVELVWVDRAGQTEPVGAEAREYQWVRVSPDGARLAVSAMGSDGNSDIWIYDLELGTMTRLTFDEAFDDSPFWSPDGSRVAFWSLREEGGLLWKAADGTGEVERLLESGSVVEPHGWTADGRPVVQWLDDIGVVTTESGGTLQLLLDAEFEERSPSISPDGRWIAYASDESGRQEVYVRPFPDIEAGGRWQVSAAGGQEPVWSPNGRELFFLEIDASGSPVTFRMMAAAVDTESSFRHATPEALFGLEDIRTSIPLPPYDFARFLASSGGNGTLPPAGIASSSRIPRQIAGANQGLVFVLNWTQELLERVPVP